MLKRIGRVLVVVAAMPLIVGAGGMGPPQDASRKTTGPAVTATVVIDPHNSGVTSTAGRATIRLQKGSLVSGATFTIPSSFVLNRGCDLNLTELRFVYTAARPIKLSGWFPDAAVLNALFAPLGITPDPVNNIPVLTDVDNDGCTVDPANPGVVDTGNTYGAVTCPDNTLCTNPNNQNILTNGGDGSPALAGILSFTGVIQFEVAH
jgi:hypothetical protein